MHDMNFTAYIITTNVTTVSMLGIYASSMKIDILHPIGILMLRCTKVNTQNMFSKQDNNICHGDQKPSPFNDTQSAASVFLNSLRNGGDLLNILNIKIAFHADNTW